MILRKLKKMKKQGYFEPHDHTHCGHDHHDHVHGEHCDHDHNL
jgi:hypothetical protein